jgi:hypothetical protein
MFREIKVRRGTATGLSIFPQIQIEIKVLGAINAKSPPVDGVNNVN